MRGSTFYLALETSGTGCMARRTTIWEATGQPRESFGARAAASDSIRTCNVPVTFRSRDRCSFFRERCSQEPHCGYDIKRRTKTIPYGTRRDGTYKAEHDKRCMAACEAVLDIGREMVGLGLPARGGCAQPRDCLRQCSPQRMEQCVLQCSSEIGWRRVCSAVDLFLCPGCLLYRDGGLCLLFHAEVAAPVASLANRKIFGCMAQGPRVLPFGSCRGDG